MVTYHTMAYYLSQAIRTIESAVAGAPGQYHAWYGQTTVEILVEARSDRYADRVWDSVSIREPGAERWWACGNRSGGRNALACWLSYVLANSLQDGPAAPLDWYAITHPNDMEPHSRPFPVLPEAVQ